MNKHVDIDTLHSWVPYYNRKNILWLFNWRDTISVDDIANCKLFAMYKLQLLYQDYWFEDICYYELLDKIYARIQKELKLKRIPSAYIPRKNLSLSKNEHRLYTFDCLTALINGLIINEIMVRYTILDCIVQLIKEGEA